MIAIEAILAMRLNWIWLCNWKRLKKEVAKAALALETAVPSNRFVTENNGIV